MSAAATDRATATAWPHPPGSLPATGVPLSAQTREQLGGRWTILNRQKADYVALERPLDRLADTPPAQQDAVLRRIYRLVFPHAFAEEAVLWPVIRRVLPDGAALTLRIEQEHQRINERVSRLEALEPGSAAHRQTLDRLVPLLREDVRDEEDALFPRLQARLSVTQLRLLGLAWEGVRRIAPTRPHPVVARRPPGNMLSGLPLTLLDRCRDAIDRAIQHRHRAVALTTTSRALRDTAHAVEYAPGMRSGEDSSTRIGRAPRYGAGVAALAIGLASVVGLAAYHGRGAGRPRA